MSRPPLDDNRDVISLAGKEIPFTYRRSTRARRMSLRVVPGIGLEVVLPPGFSRREGQTLVRRKQAWVLRTLRRMERQTAGKTELVDGATLPFGDTQLTLVLKEGASRSSARLVGTQLIVAASGGRSVLDVVERWYRRQAAEMCADMAAEHATRLGVTIGRITIKDTRSRWGSASGKGNLNFSWRLLLAPPEVLNYVVAHEVAHLRELNHSDRFWAIVEELVPDWRAQRSWLRKHGREIGIWPGLQ